MSCSVVAGMEACGLMKNLETVLKKNIENLLHTDSECTIKFTHLRVNRIFNNIKVTG